MRKYVFIGCGCFVGAILRYLIEGIKITGYHENVPLNTLFINISGAFLMALILTVAFEIWVFDSDIRLGLTTGILGAYTTFSTMCKEASTLLFQGDYFSAISYLTVSTILGLGAVYIGIVVAHEVGLKLLQKKKNDDTVNGDESGVD